MQYPKFAQLMSQLIAAPSISAVSPEWDQSNLKVINLLAEWCEHKGFKVEILHLHDCPGKANIIATYGSGPDGLVLSGHTDTVPFDEGEWASDPFTVVERDNRWFGLGTADMKGFFAIILEALRDVDLKKLKKPLIILGTADEETGMSGAKSLVAANKQLGRHAVIGEPTGLKPIRAHKGTMMEGIRLNGHAGHSSNPSLGKNALEGMYKVMGELLVWRDELQKRYQNPMFEIDVPTMNLGHIHGGDNPNRICAHCELHFDVRTLPGMSHTGLRDEIDARLAVLLADSGLEIERKQLTSGTEAMDTPASAEIIKAAEKLTGYSAETVAFGTEGPYLNALGMNTVILGPGHIEQAHQPNEYIDMREMKPAIKIIRDLVRKFCM